MAEAKFVNKEKILARFARTPPIIEAAAATALKTQVDDMTAALKRAAPISELEGHPGELRDSIAANATPGRVQSYRIVAWARDAQGKLNGRYVEFGHTAKGGKFVHAVPFWFSTYRARKREMVRKIRGEVRAAIKANF